MNNPNILLSVIIPTYNYGHLLSRSLGSVLTQLSPACELIVVDDGSKDSTPAVLEALSEKYPAIFRVIHQANEGAAVARNRGLRASRGGHILFLDADDELMPGALNAICLAFQSNPKTTVVIGGRMTCWPNGKVKHHPPPPPSSLDVDPCQRVANYLLRKTVSVSHGAVAVARGLAECRTYPEAFRSREDMPVSTYWLAHGVIQTISTPLVRIHKHDDSLRHTTVINETLELKLADEIFTPLPEACQVIKSPFIAQRYLALCAISISHGEWSGARGHLVTALRLDPRQLFVRKQFLKLLKLLLRSVFK